MRGRKQAGGGEWGIARTYEYLFSLSRPLNIDRPRHVNENFDVAGLCREFPSRLQEVANRSGGRLLK